MKTNVALRDMDSELWVEFKRLAKNRKSTMAKELSKIMLQEIKKECIYKAYIHQTPQKKESK